MQNIPLEKGIIFGPINSRRLGQSLGINLLPTSKKYCSFNCVYCFFGATSTFLGEFTENELPKLEQILKAIDNALLRIKNDKLQIDFITFAGNGEPTLNPEYPKVVDYLLTAIKDFPLNLKTAIFTNGSQLWKKDVFEATAKLNQAIVKIDIVDREGFKTLNRPKGNIDLDKIVNHAAKLPNLRIQTAIMKINGKIYNDESLLYYCQLLRIASPIEVQIYNIIYPPAENGIEAVTNEELSEFANKLRSLTNFNVTAYNNMENSISGI